MFCLFCCKIGLIILIDYINFAYLAVLLAKECIIGLSHTRPNFGISGVLLNENEAKPVVICCSAGGCYRLVHVVINFADVN